MQQESANCITALQTVEKATGTTIAVAVMGTLVQARRSCKRAIIVEWCAREIQINGKQKGNNLVLFVQDIQDKMKDKGLTEKGLHRTLTAHTHIVALHFLAHACCT